MDEGVKCYALVLAGGVGTRLWPLSRRDHPKQLLPLLGDDSMLQATVARLAPLVPPERVLVLTNVEYVATARAQLPGVPADQIVGEPEALGTAAAVGLGAALIRARDPDATMFSVHADHVIRPEPAFRATLARAAEVAAGGHLVTLGIRPARPETGYGYIELGEPLSGPGAGFAVRQFVEKPDRATAERYVASGRHLWNSGLFAWTVASIFTAFERHLPDLAAHLDEIGAAAAAGTLEHALPATWSRITDRTTIDYGIIERAERVACVPAEFAWHDVGSWAALADVLDADTEGNVVVGSHIGHDTSDSFVFAPNGRLVATVGVEGLVIVDTGDVILVCPRHAAQDVRAIVERLRARGAGDYL